MRESLLEKVMEASGLAPILAKGVVERALVRAGIEPSALDRDSLERALPELLFALSIYLPSTSVQAKLNAVYKLTKPISGEYVIRLDDDALSD